MVFPDTARIISALFIIIIYYYEQSVMLTIQFIGKIFASLGPILYRCLAEKDALNIFAALQNVARDQANPLYNRDIWVSDPSLLSNNFLC